MLAALSNFVNQKKFKGPNITELLDDIFKNGIINFNNHIKYFEKYGDTIKMVPIWNTYITRDADVIEYILKSNMDNFQKKSIFWQRMRVAFGNSLLTAEGEEWQKTRSVVMSNLTKNYMDRYSCYMVDYINEYTKKISFTSKKNSFIDVQDLMVSMTLKIAAKAICSIELNDVDAKKLGDIITFGNCYIALASNVLSILPSIKKFQFKYKMKYLHKFVEQIINDRIDLIKNAKNNDLESNNTKNNINIPDDMLTALINNNLSLEQIKYEIIVLLSTGHETTACSLAWGIYLLATNQDKLQKLQEEIDNKIENEVITKDDLVNLPFNRAVFKETLRLYPSIWGTNRLQNNQDNIQGVNMKPKTEYMVHFYALHRNPKYWDLPNEFLPERFIEQELKPRHKYAYLPFSVGAHACIAGSFSNIEGQLALGNFAKNFNFELKKRSKVEMYPLISLRAKKGIIIKFSKRNLKK